MPRIYNPHPDHLTQQLREIFNPKRSPADESPTKGIGSSMTQSVAVQIQQLAAPLISADFRIIPVVVGDQTKYMVTDVNNQNYVVTLHPGLGSCSCGSKFFCHHILGCRIKAGVQSDLKIPANAKLPKPSDMDKRYRGRREVHGTKKPIAADAIHAGIDKKKKISLLTTKKSRLGDKSEDVEKEDDNEDDGLDWPEPQSALFLSLPEKPFAKKSQPPPPVEENMDGLVSGPICVFPPPLSTEKHEPMSEVTPGVVELVEQSITQTGNSSGAVEISYFDFSAANAYLDQVATIKRVVPETPNEGIEPMEEDLQEATVVVTGQPATTSSVHSPWGNPGRPIMSSTAFTLSGVEEDNLDNLRLSLSSDDSHMEENTSSKSTCRKRGLTTEEILKALGQDSEEDDRNPVPKKKGRKSVSFDVSGTDVTEIDPDNLQEKHLRMGPKERRKFRVGSSLFTFQTKEPGMVIIHTETGEVPPSVLRSAATAGANQALLKLSSKNSSKVYTVKVSIHVEGTPEMDLRDPQEFEVSCVCGEAINRKEPGPRTINCTICQRIFHKEHVENSGKVTSYKCQACSQSILGLKWGAGKYTNTCPIDGFLTASSLAFKQNPSLLQDLRAFGDVAEQQLADAIEQAQSNYSGAAQNIWGDYITSCGPEKKPNPSKTDLSGDVFGRTAEALGPSVKFITRTFCPNGKMCSSRRTSAKTIKESSLPADSPSVAEGLAFILGSMAKQCNTCTDEHLSPLVGTKKVGVPHQKQPPLFFYLSTIQLKFSPEDYMNGPQEIEVEDIKYRLHSIHLFSRESAHFRTLIQVGEAHRPSWLLYDGLANKSKKKTNFRVALPTDYANHKSAENYIPSYVIYIKV